jgi:hypothetical protein
MPLQAAIDQCTNRVKELSMHIAQSAANYNQKDADLKQHLANHNVLIGQLSEAQKTLAMLKPEPAPESMQSLEPVENPEE